MALLYRNLRWLSATIFVQPLLLFSKSGDETPPALGECHICALYLSTPSDFCSHFGCWCKVTA